MSDVVEQLRALGRWFKADGWDANANVAFGGADEIKRLHKLVTKMARDSDAVAFDVRTKTIEECARAGEEWWAGDRRITLGEALRALAKEPA